MNEGSGMKTKNQCQDQGDKNLVTRQAWDTQTGGRLMNGGSLVLILVSQHLISIPITSDATTHFLSTFLPPEYWWDP